MSIQIQGTTVIDDSKNVTNVASITLTTGKVTGVSAPTVAADATNKEYVDSYVSSVFGLPL